MKIKINLTQKTANKLMVLYREMDLVPEDDFNQWECNACVIGHGIHNGIINGFTDTEEEFDDAVAWVGLPTIKVLDDEDELDCRRFAFGILGDYLFGTGWDVDDAAEILKLTNPKPHTPKAAQKRIKALLNRAGYDVVWNV